MWSLTAQRTSTSTRLYLYKHTHADTLMPHSFEVSEINSRIAVMYVGPLVGSLQAILTAGSLIGSHVIKPIAMYVILQPF